MMPRLVSCKLTLRSECGNVLGHIEPLVCSFNVWSFIPRLAAIIDYWCPTGAFVTLVCHKVLVLSIL